MEGHIAGSYWIAVHQDPQVLLCQPAFQPQHGPVHAVVPPWVQDSAFPFVELHEVPLCPLLQPVKVPLNSSTHNCCINHCSQFCIIWKLVEAAHCNVVRMVNEDIKQHRPQHQPLGYTSSDRPPDRLCATAHESLGLAIPQVSVLLTARCSNPQSACLRGWVIHIYSNPIMLQLFLPILSIFF